MKGPTSTQHGWPCCSGLTEFIATSTVATVWLRGMLVLSSEREFDEGSSNGDASVGRVNLEFC